VCHAATRLHTTSRHALVLAVSAKCWTLVDVRRDHAGQALQGRFVLLVASLLEYSFRVVMLTFRVVRNEVGL